MEGNLYKRWMEDYSGEDFLGAVDRGIGMSFSLSYHVLSLLQAGVSSFHDDLSGIEDQLISRKPRKTSRG